MARRHKWKWTDGYMRAECFCGAKQKRRIRQSDKYPYKEVVDEYFIYPDGEEVKLGKMPPCIGKRS